MTGLQLAAPPRDRPALRAAFACVPQAVCAVCAIAGDERPQGLVVSSLVPVSLTPPLVSVCVNDGSSTWPTLRAAPRVGISVFAHDQDAACLTLGARGEDRFAQVEWSFYDEGAVLIDGAVSWMAGSVVNEFPGGDHRIVVIGLDALATDQTREPLVFHASRFRPLAVDAVL